jgi:hypothetical protein
MKKYILFFALVLGFSVKSSGNIAPPANNLREIYVDSLGNWTIEISFIPYKPSEIDSMKLETTSGLASIVSINYSGIMGCPGFAFWDSLGIITNANLSSPLYINISGDFVKLYLYTFLGLEISSVYIGNYQGSYLYSIQPFQSIAHIYFDGAESFCLDNSPTIGLCNDTTGAMGNFSGIIYRPDGSVFTGGFFRIADITNLNAHIQPDGTFTERVFARAYPMNQVTIYFSSPNNTDTTWSIVPVNPWLEPDSSVSFVIQTLAVISSENDKKYPVHEIVAYPNPFVTDISFYLDFKSYNYGIPFIINIYDAKGSLVYRLVSETRTSTITWSPGNDISPGIYTYMIEKDSRFIQSGKIVKLASRE